MLGAIIGDTVGSIYEFDNIKTTDFPLFSKRSEFTDDSVMCFAVADWLLRDEHHTHKELEASMVRFANQYPDPIGGYGGSFYRWLFSGRERVPYNSWGNGSAMRVSAVGWAFGTLEETLRVAEISAAITHNHPEGIKGAKAVAAAIFLGRTGKTKAEIKEYMETRFGYDLSRTCEEIRPGYTFQESCQGTVPGHHRLPRQHGFRECHPLSRLARRRRRHPRLHHRRPRRSVLPRDPRRDRKGDMVPPAGDLPRDFAGDGEGLGVSAKGECGVKVLWIRLGGGKGKSCRKKCFQKSRKCVFLQPQKFLERCINTYLKNLGNVIYETEDLRQISPVEA